MDKIHFKIVVNTLPVVSQVTTQLCDDHLPHTIGQYYRCIYMGCTHGSCSAFNDNHITIIFLQSDDTLTDYAPRRNARA